MSCTNPVALTDDVTGYTNYYRCRSCLSCRKQRARDVTLRLLMETHSWSSPPVFLTLTYDDVSIKHCGTYFFTEETETDIRGRKKLIWKKKIHLQCKNHLGFYSLYYRDLTLFWKRLRKSLNGRKIKYYAVGEYGSKSWRCHFHAIVYGLTLDDRQKVIDAWPYCEPFMFSETKKDSGFQIADVGAIAYVAGYVQKKLYDKRKKYCLLGLDPPQPRLSHGLGLDYVLDNPYIIKQGGIFRNGYKQALPEYFRKKLDIHNYDISKDTVRLQDMKNYLNKHGIDTSGMSPFKVEELYTTRTIMYDLEELSKMLDTKEALIKTFSKGI